MSAHEASVQVVVRLRPLNGREQKSNTTPIVTASTERSEVTVIKGTGKAQMRNTFKFANVFGSFTTQEEIFEQTLEPGALPPRAAPVSSRRRRRRRRRRRPAPAAAGLTRAVSSPAVRSHRRRHGWL
jgi:hypothetical protein